MPLAWDLAVRLARLCPGRHRHPETLWRQGGGVVWDVLQARGEVCGPSPGPGGRRVWGSVWGNGGPGRGPRAAGMLLPVWWPGHVRHLCAGRKAAGTLPTHIFCVGLSRRVRVATGSVSPSGLSDTLAGSGEHRWVGLAALSCFFHLHLTSTLRNLPTLLTHNTKYANPPGFFILLLGSA